jgi:hypothetical protein
LSNFKDDYYSQVDQVFDKLKVTPFEERVGGTSVPQEDGGQIQPVGWVENADATDGTATVKIDSDGITITDGKLSVEDASGNSIISGGVVKALTNDGAEVVIDGSGITVTDGAITVENPTGTVIIDGTSNMFKIQATGTFSQTVADNTDLATTSVTLSGLGALATTPAHIGYIAGSNTTGAQQANGFAQKDASDFVSSTSGGSVNQNRVVATVAARIATSLNGSNEAVVESRMTTAGVGASTTWFMRYYVLKEAAL